MSIPKSNTITSLDRDYAGSNLLNNANAFVAKYDRLIPVMFIGTAESGVCCLDVYFTISKVTADFILHNLALCGAAENIVRDAHFIDSISLFSCSPKLVQSV